MVLRIGQFGRIRYLFEDDSEGICVVLKENFRSDENILKSSDFVFNRLMENKNAGVSYDEDSALYYPEAKERQDTEIIPTKLINGKVNYFTGEIVENKKDYREQSIENITYEILLGIKNGKKYERDSYQVLSESELNALLKSKNAKRLDSTTEKNTKLYLDWLFHNNN